MTSPDMLRRPDALQKETGPDYAGRIKRLRELTASTGASAALITNPRNVRYFTGFKGAADLDEREIELLVTPNKTHMLFKPFYDEEVKTRTQNMERIPTRRPFNYSVDFSDVAATLQAEQLPLSLAAEYANFRWNELDALEAAGFQKKDRKPIDVEGDIRAIKDSWEIAQIQEACRIGDAGLTHILGQLKPGMTEIQVKEQLETHLLSQPGVDGLSFPALIAYGGNASSPHYEGGSTVLEHGNFLTIDFGVTVNGYHSDMTRVVFIGEPTPEQVVMYADALTAQQRALDYAASADPVEAKRIDEIANEYLVSRGYPAFVAHSHGIGSADHERPDLLPTSTDSIKPNMVFTAEPGIYIPGIAGIRIEDEMRKTEDGIEIFTHSSKDLICIDLPTGKQTRYAAKDLLAGNFEKAA